ncbi:potassium-transporting ATPase subunit C [Nocardia otitidiscaviarum]|uniref:Potassium-transporting ATPase KdpC subunit n=1 Tax=Nocardia otitidiscaviarum TaxID=1823 RepID=A0A516NPQ7_9NOCA|nr:potassium-transporting ATPase subunit C [Nocardia otitidiscaviarum]MCP9623808.1 potassium-transporting ATPase subunit C [Nocardia otitidiscaviarum]QDP80892.1 potassium-transporting ATPase subunit C [Nocardia otitidiscaviarum]
MRTSTWIRQHLAALRALLVLTVITGIVYPVAVFAVAQLPGLRDKADGSLVERDGALVGSSLVGQSFTDADGNALAQYFQSRPSVAGDGYDPLSTSASNLGPEDIVDTADTTSLLTEVCTRSKEVGEREGVDGRRAYCTPAGVGAVLSVIGPRSADGTVEHPTTVVSVNELCPATPFLATYRGVTVECAVAGEDYSIGRLVPIAGDVPAVPAVPADAVTASGSGLDPHISPAYAAIQVARVARARGVPADAVRALVAAHTSGRDLGFLGEPRVNVLELNLDLDSRFPLRG